MKLRDNNKGFAITSFLYSILVVFLVILSVLITNVINTKLTIERLKQQVKNGIQDELVNDNPYLKLLVEPKEVVIRNGSIYDFYSGLYLFRYDNTKVMNDDIKNNIKIEPVINDIDSYSINYSVLLNGVEYKNNRILKITDASGTFLAGQGLTDAVNELLNNSKL